MKKSCNVFTVIGIVVTALAAIAGVAYAVYYFLERKNCLCDDYFEFDCEDCNEDCDECPKCVCEDDDEIVEAE